MKRTLVVLVLAVLMVLGSVMPANANSYSRKIGRNEVLVTHGYTAKPTGIQEHRQIAVFDRVCDGKIFKAVYVIGGFSHRYTVRDLNGCLPGGTAINWNKVPGKHEIRSFKACIRDRIISRHVWRCTPWRRVFSHARV